MSEEQNPTQKKSEVLSSQNQQQQNPTHSPPDQNVFYRVNKELLPQQDEATTE